MEAGRVLDERLFCIKGLEGAGCRGHFKGKWIRDAENPTAKERKEREKGFLGRGGEKRRGIQRREVDVRE